MSHTTKYHKKGFKKRNYSKFILGGDIGGTNTNIGISGVKNSKCELLFSFHFKSKELKSLVPALNEALNYAKNKHKISVKDACIAVAGVVKDYKKARLTNVKWDVDSKEILKKTDLKSLFIMNDFQAIGYAVNFLNKKDFMKICHKSHKHSEKKYAPKAIIGAGTGLGISMLIYNKSFKAYIPIASEGGHGDFPAQDDFEIKLLKFIKKYRKIKSNISYEQLLSGRGIENIFLFLRSNYKNTKYTTEIMKSTDRSRLISKYRKVDHTCKETMKLFSKYYARCAKNFALDAIANGGLYIAGGIAAKNYEIFKSKDFMKEFENVNRQAQILKSTPVYIIKNYDISLDGACYAAILRKDLAIKR